MNAFYWLTARARLKPVQVWTFLGLFSGWWIWIWLKSHVAWFDPIMATTPAIILNSTIKAWIALEAAQQLAEDRKAGALELLLSTPLNVRDILRGQYLALRRQFFKPLLLMIAVELIFMTAQARHAASAERNQISSFWAAGIVMLMADVMTLPMVAMRVSLTAKSPNRASVSTISRVLILPWFLFGIGAAIADLWTGLFSDAGEMPGWKTLLGLWFGTGMVVDLCFGLTAWWQLLHKFRELANRELARGARGLAGPQIVAAKLATRPAGMAPEPEPSLAPRLSRRKRALLYGSALIALLGGVFVTHWRAEGNLPSPLLVSITRSNAPLRVFSGGAFDMILPDGSLWRWGATSGSVPVQSWPVAPGQLGTNCDWLQVSSMGNRNVGLSKDGTLWQWWSMGLVPTSVSGRGRDQLDEAHDWISASTSWEHSVALKQNGTLWAWGENTSGQLGNGPGPNQNGPVQVGTNSDWVAVTCVGTATFGLRANGTLWIWGRAWNYSQGGLPVVFPAPVQFCQETNWTAVGAGFGFLAWTSSGEVWRPNPGSANAQAPASATCEFISSNAQPDRLAITRWQAPKLYEARRDGTLWERNCSFPGRPVPVDVTWRRVGKRTDWVAIWGNGATAVGLTADNTIWTWGIDPTREAILSFVGRVQRLNYRMNELFGTRRPPTPMMFGGPGFKRPAVRITPRALMRMAISTAKPTNGATMFRSEER